jgi:hypothetical protein
MSASKMLELAVVGRSDIHGLLLLGPYPASWSRVCTHSGSTRSGTFKRSAGTILQFLTALFWAAIAVRSPTLPHALG